ncbi:MAG TPA: NYN domain-containing protein [Terriglobia bacterium]|nr:NYN domain-containing protein [Terriglobia bacterium]
MAEERMKLAVFIDFDNIQIGVKDTLGKEFDVSLVLEALKERGEVVTKVGYGDWSRAGENSRQMTQHAVQMVQRNVTPRGDKNGADINLALDALEMAFTRDHINAFAIVGGDSDFIALVEKLKQYDKRVFVVGGRSFTSNILQRNCHEFIAYENLLQSAGSAEVSRVARSSRTAGRSTTESRSLTAAFPNVQRALKILADREVAPQLGPLKSTVLQLDSTFSERDYGAGSFREFMQKMEQAGLVHLRRIDRGYLVEAIEGDSEKVASPAAPQEVPASVGSSAPAGDAGEEGTLEAAPPISTLEQVGTAAEALGLLKLALAAAAAKSPNRPLYMRHIRQALRAANKDFDERRYGFRGFLDFLHQGQREGWLRLQRDRKGVWRVFQVIAPPAISAQASAAGVPAVEAMDGTAVNSMPPPDSDAVLPEPTITEEMGDAGAETQEAPTVLAEEVPVTDAPSETPAPAKPRKGRPARGTGARVRKTASRRKPKSTDAE